MKDEIVLPGGPGWRFVTAGFMPGGRGGKSKRSAGMVVSGVDRWNTTL
jgi:hypothetical protein